MRRPRLNLSALRAAGCPRSSEKPRQPASRDAMNLTRRRFIELSSVAAVAAAPCLDALGRTLVGPLECVGDRRRLTFRLGGVDRWVIDPRRFGGRPRLEVHKNDRLIRARLLNATYPGTSLPADFNCEISSAGAGWQLKLSLAIGGFEDELPFEPWLLGATAAHSNVRLDDRVCDAQGNTVLQLAGEARAAFSPAWSLRLTGGDLVSVSAFGDHIGADGATITLADPATASLLRPAAPKRTIVSIDRNGRTWSLNPQLAADGWRVISSGQPFDALTLEAGEYRSSSMQHAVVAESTGEESHLAVEPASELVDPDGSPFRLRLRHARYAVMFDADGTQRALFGDFDRRPAWLHAGGCSVQLGHRGDTPPFELVARNGHVERLRCAPALLRVAAPLPGALVEPTRVNAGASFAFRSGSAGDTEPSDAGQIRIDPRKLPRKPPQIPRQPQSPTQPSKPAEITSLDKLRVKLAIANPSVSVVRAEDLLVVRFEFINLKLEAGGGPQAQLVRTGRPAYIVAHLPPQSIAEQAFYQVAEQMKDPDAAKGNDPLATPPVGSRLAGPSRLSFVVPDQITAIPYTLSSLLRACSEYEQSVCSRALPAPAPARRERTLTLPVQGITRRKLPGASSLAPNDQTMGAPGKPRLRLPQTAQPTRVAALAPMFAITPPVPHETAVEAPYRLIVSPNKHAGWIHAGGSTPALKHGRVELWHTRLGIRSGPGRVYDGRYLYDRTPEGLLRVTKILPADEQERDRTLRAIWSPDFSPNPPSHPDDPRPFRMSLDERDRSELVSLTSGLTDPAALSRVVHVDRLMLSALGAWMDVRYAANVSSPFSVEAWRHRATMGRDHYVQVVYKGYLFPLGHRASLIKVTERKFERATPGSIAYLRQHMYIVVREPEKTYPAFAQPYDGRLMPFRRVRIVTKVTPDLDRPEDCKVPGVKKTPNGSQSASAQAAFWPQIGKQYFPFQLSVEDWDGQPSDFTAPLIFVGSEDSVAFRKDTIEAIQKEYLSTAHAGERTRDLFGQKVAYATSGKPGDTTLETAKFELGVELPLEDATHPAIADATFEAQNQPRFYPAMRGAAVRIPPIQHLLGKDQPAEISFHETYVKDAFAGANKGQIFVHVKNSKLDFRGSGDKAGGMVTPNIGISGLSRLMGPVGGDLSPAKAADSLLGGKFNPKDFFKDVLSEAKILGGISLADILDVVESVTGDLGKVPKLNAQPYAGGQPLTNQQLLAGTPAPEELRTTFAWETDRLKTDPLGLFVPQNSTKLHIDANLIAKLPNGGPPPAPTSTVQGTLNNFEVDLFHFIIVAFDKFQFTVKAGKKPDVDVRLRETDGVRFGGPLEFINELREWIPASGFSDPPSLEISPTGITAGFSFGIPSIMVGVMSIQNITLGASLTIPFTGDPVRVRFNFCERENPFLLTIYVFGGGGFFALAVGADGVELLEASLEFGGNMAFDIGVASGGIYLMAGIYFKWEDKGGKGSTELTGYVELGGAVEVLGLIVISINFYMGLTYASEGNKVWGEATLTVEIEIAFFSKSVEMTARKEFADPDRATFAKLMPAQSQWDTYCDAFA